MVPGGPARIGHAKNDNLGWELGSWPLGNCRPLWHGDNVYLRSLHDRRCFYDAGHDGYASEKEPVPEHGWVLQSLHGSGELQFGEPAFLCSAATGRYL